MVDMLIVRQSAANGQPVAASGTGMEPVRNHPGVMERHRELQALGVLAAAVKPFWAGGVHRLLVPGTYLASHGWLDSFRRSATGRATQKRFQDVQDRLGFFDNRCPFRPPPKRRP
jgi:hypothetical protein